ncbi:helix-turn-helix domain-containing protein [Epibacterium ulvae]|uniref:helix-turn-helix domain-containing protein n=1 Tax=Epibacterium ulvae TaxID=1156985 RepID=UPI00248F80EE|nr:LysR family transcriptional regulator [Epibacterium ulvae]
MSQDHSLSRLAVLRCFSEAAENLGFSQGAISRHVKDLETYFGTALFQREGQGVRLTPAGEQSRILRLSEPPTFSSPRLRAAVVDCRIC